MYLAAAFEDAWACVPVLLYLFWGLASAAACIALLPIRQIDTFRAMVYLAACRGKLWQGRPLRALGSLNAWKVPQAWFAHFYDIGLAANSGVLLLVFRSLGMTMAPVTLALGLLQAHLLRRSLETHCLLKYPRDAYMHAIAYAFGLAYYTVLPLTCLPGEVFDTPLSLTFKTSKKSLHEQAGLERFTAQHILGCLTVISGNLLQHDSHRKLAALSADGSAGETNYKIPRGGGFELVSCPHYLGEIVIYIGLTLLLDLRRPLPWLPLIWVVANLVLAAVPTHQWYKQKFADYPPHRRALIPYLL